MGKVQLEDIFKNLKMDKISVDTTKAKEYLETHKEFHSDSSITEKVSEPYVIDSFGCKIFCLQQNGVDELRATPWPSMYRDSLAERSITLKKLAVEIERNFDLICQLEYLIRNIPVRETKHSIHLILQHLHFSIENELITREETCVIQKDTPLLALGCYFQSFKLFKDFYLFATNETAMICHLFTELCHNVGLKCKLVIKESKSITVGFKVFRDVFNDLAPEVTGIITEKSDVDSAVDTFLNSEAHPFPLARIFVQESVYKDFKDIVTWKCRSQQKANIHFKSNCLEAFKYENKTFYLDYAGDIEEAKKQSDLVVFVEAFRTINELLSLLNQGSKKLCLSVWASGVSEANEIALNANVPIVWINDYCNFDGPPEVSQAVFDKTYSKHIMRTNKETIERLTQHQRAWDKKSFSDRYETVIKAFDDINDDIANAIRKVSKTNWKHNDFISRQDTTIVTGFKIPIPVVNFVWPPEVEHDLDEPEALSIWLSIACALMNGSAILNLPNYLNKSVSDICNFIFERLAKFGCPSAVIEIDLSSDFHYEVTSSYYAESVQTKVIWTSFGTKFAN